MNPALRLAGYREPLGLWVRSTSRMAERPDLRLQEIEFSSRGDRVTGHVILPAEGAGPLPLVLLQPGQPGGTRTAVETLGASWAERGASVASIDFPLHGARADAKLLSLLPDAGEADASDEIRTSWIGALAHEFTRQAVVDLERAIDALGAMEWTDEERIAFVGFGLGARVGSAFCALDARVRAAVLGPGAGGPHTPDARIADWQGRIAPRPVLLLGPRSGSSARDDAVLDAAEGTAVALRIDADPADLPGAAVEAITGFLSRTIGI